MTALVDSSNPALAAMFSRRSTAKLVEPEPTPREVEIILRAATTVPDHGRLTPWRLVVVPPSGRARFGDALAAAALEADPSTRAAVVERTRAKAFAAPMMIAVVAAVREGKVARWEQIASACCAGYAMTLAAHALGLGAIWKSSSVVRGRELSRVLALEDLDEFLGWVNLGHVPDQPEGAQPRPEVDLATVAMVLDPEATRLYEPGVEP